jgi:hypothetical protein
MAEKRPCFEFHGTRAAFERDRRRDQQLRIAGWEQPADLIAAIAS